MTKCTLLQRICLRLGLPQVAALRDRLPARPNRGAAGYHIPENRFRLPIKQTKEGGLTNENGPEKQNVLHIAFLQPAIMLQLRRLEYE